MNKWEYKEVKIKQIKELLNNHEIEVLSPDGYIPVKKYVEKGKKQIWKLNVNKKQLYCSEKHLIETNLGWMFVNELNPTMHKILCEDDKYHSFKLEKTNIKKKVVDISVEHKNHRYYTNGISSHNTNLGKSLIKCALATNCLLQNKNVLYVTLEMSENMISERIVSNLFDININDLAFVPKQRFMSKFEKMNKKLKSKLVIKEYPTSSINTHRIRSLLKELKNKNNFIPDVVFIDMVDIMLPNRIMKGGNTNTELRTICQEIRGLAMETKIPFVSSRQINREGHNSAEIGLTNVAESIGTTTVADVIFGITQTPELREARKYCFILLKNRFGLNKIKKLINVDYKKMRISDEISDDSELNLENSIEIVDKAAVDVLKKINNTKKHERNNIIQMDD